MNEHISNRMTIKFFKSLKIALSLKYLNDSFWFEINKKRTHIKAYLLMKNVFYFFYWEHYPSLHSMIFHTRQWIGVCMFFCSNHSNNSNFPTEICFPISLISYNQNGVCVFFLSFIFIFFMLSSQIFTFVSAR